MKYNYHSHTKWCKHGSGEIEDYIKESLSQSLQVCAITEHIPLPSKEGTVYSMGLNEIAPFSEELDMMIHKYQNSITIYKGLECEYYPKWFDFFSQIKQRFGYQFLILGNHFREDEKTSYFKYASPELLDEYASGLVNGMRSGLFSFVAHPDCPIMAYGKWDTSFIAIAHRIFAVAEETNTPLEINAAGFRGNRGYPVQEFWKVSKEYNIDILINSDSHNPEEVWDCAMDQAYTFADNLGLTIIDTFQFR